MVRQNGEEVPMKTVCACWKQPLSKTRPLSIDDSCIAAKRLRESWARTSALCGAFARFKGGDARRDRVSPSPRANQKSSSSRPAREVRAFLCLHERHDVLATARRGTPGAYIMTTPASTRSAQAFLEKLRLATRVLDCGHWRAHTTRSQPNALHECHKWGSSAREVVG